MSKVLLGPIYALGTIVFRFRASLLLEGASGRSILAGQGTRQGSSFPRRARTEALVSEW